MLIKSATFEVSNSKATKCPQTQLPEYAFIGRSNVGKSSLINMLMQNRKLAKTSSRPGKTQLINHFLVNKQWYLVDLPGYGYAKVSKTKKEKFQGLIADYLFQRSQLVCAFVLIDVRLEPQKIDLEFMAFLAEYEVPFCMVFTKADKLTRHHVNKNIAFYRKVMLKQWESFPEYFVTSSVNQLGREEILDYIDGLNTLYESS
ncbi:MAG: YihA family ribosome biogenesis GTP-binding protein [Flavobacteriia bacterium]|nr:MAG: YihA family ribosome biogenesis GTP-binding protein [Flavobacteriia bacterium]